ncbi:MAG: hypothetical protein HZC28_16830 [Spirochaetes bacterium]|nr:hypothetical protein [Spirochaetota bacterium]
MLLRITLLITTVAVMLTAAPAAPSVKTAKNSRVGIITFVAKAGTTAPDAEVVEEMFRNGLVQSRKYDVLDRNNMKDVLKEQEFQQTGCTDTECAVKIGKILNMEYMMYGSIMKMGTSFLISVGMVNVETSKIENTAQEKFATMDLADKAVQKVITSLTGVQPGTDTSGSGRTITINVPGRGLTNITYGTTTTYTTTGAMPQQYEPNPFKTALYIVSPIMFTGGTFILLYEFIYGPMLGGSGMSATASAYSEYQNATDNVLGAWQRYSDAVLWSDIRIIGGGTLAAIGIGAFIWALAIPDVPVKTAVVPVITADTVGIAWNIRF